MPEVVQVFDSADQRSKVADGFENFVSRVGINAGQNQNVLSASFYAFNLLTKNRLQLEAAYRGSWIVGQMVNAVAEDMTKAGINITTNQKDFDIKKLQREIIRRQIGNSLCSTIAWARLYGGAIAVMQIEGQALHTPLDFTTIKQGQFKGLVVYDRWQINPDLTDLIRQGPELGMPRFYQIVTDWDTTNPAELKGSGYVKVHHSRVIRQIGIELPYNQAITEMMWGESELERLWDRLISFDSTSMDTANLVNRANNRVVSIDQLREIVAAGGPALKGLQAQFDMMREFQTNEGLTLLDKDDVFTQTSYSFAGLDSVLLQFGQQLSGATGIPLVRLFGQSPAGLSATGDADLRTYYDNINAKQNSKLTNAWEKILRAMFPSVFGKEMPEDLEFTFVPLWQMSELDRATLNNTNTTTVIAAEEAGLVKRSTAMKELRAMSGDGGLFSNITDEDIAEAEQNDDPPIPDLVKPEKDPAAEGPKAEEAIEQTKDAALVAKVKRWFSKSR